MKRETRIWLAASTVVAALLVTLVVPALVAPAQATAVTPSVSPPAQWAYGGQRWVNVTSTLPHGTFAAEAFFGWQVVVTATNTSPTTVELEVQRSLGISYEAQYCSPGCKSPSAEGQVSILGYESDVGFANLTSNANVTQGGMAVPALGLLNASSASQAKLNESLVLTLSGSNGTHSASGYLNVSGNSMSNVSFGSAGIGLVPWGVEPGATWNSTGMFNASGAWGIDYSLQATGFNGDPSSESAKLAGTVNATGSIAVFGTDLGNVTLNNGMSVPQIVFVVVGPFDLVDGVVLIPHDFDLFNAAPRPWSASAPGVPSAATGDVDLMIDHAHHAFRFTAALTNYAAASQSITDSTASTSVSSAVTPTSGVDPTAVQAQPETVAQAQSASQCYASGCEAPGALPAAGGGLLGGLGVVLLVGLLVAAVVGSVAALEWRAWSRRKANTPPPPPSSGANTYAPAGAQATSGVPPPPPPNDSAGFTGPK